MRCVKIEVDVSNSPYGLHGPNASLNWLSVALRPQKPYATETVGLLGTGAQDVRHLDFLTAPELCNIELEPVAFIRAHELCESRGGRL